MRSSRLLALLMQLQLRGRISAPALARQFEVSVRTIYRDVDALSAAGVPVYAERGRFGGVVLRGGFRTGLTGLTRDEARSVPLSGAGPAARDLGLGAQAAAAQLKLLASLPSQSGADALRMAERFHLDALPWYHRPETLDTLPVLAAAVWHDHRVRIGYDAWDGHSVREVGPLGLVLKGGIWYLVAMASGRPRTFRVSSIRHMEVLPAAVKRPAGFDLSTYWPRSVAQFEARLLCEVATVLISEEGCRILRAVHPLAAERVQATQRPLEPALATAARDGWVRAELPFETAAYSARQLLRLGSEVEILAPEALRQAIEREATAVARLYRSGRADLGPGVSRR